MLHTVVGSDDDTAYIITAYLPNTDKKETYEKSLELSGEIDLCVELIKMKLVY